MVYTSRKSDIFMEFITIRGQRRLINVARLSKLSPDTVVILSQFENTMKSI